MKATFTDFIIQNVNCKKFTGDSEAMHIFENILSRDENIIAMIDASKAGKPALAACLCEVETYYKGRHAPSFILTDGFTKQALGRMVKTVLEPFGYQPDKQKDMPRGIAAEFVTSAMTYKFSGNATMKIVHKIEECNE